MERQSIILNRQAIAIEAQVEADNLFNALHLFKEWTTNRDTSCRKLVVLLISRLNEIQQADRSGRLSFTQVSRLKTKLKSDVLDLLYDLSTNGDDYLN